MSKHLGTYSQYHGPAGKVLTDFVEANIPLLWNYMPERITHVANTGAEYTGVIWGHTEEDPFHYAEDKLLFFSPHVTSLARPKLSINGLPLVEIVEPTDPAQTGETTKTLAAGAMIPGQDYLLWYKEGQFELILEIRGIADALRAATKVVQQINSDTDIATYDGDAIMLETSGFSTFRDGGGKFWHRGTTSPPVTTPPLPSYFKRQAFDGHWYEAVCKRTVFAETAGLLGDQTVDIAGPLNELITWLGLKGGGRIVLPPGSSRFESSIFIHHNGIELSGTSTGNSDDGNGTNLYSATNGAALIVGGRMDLGEDRNNNIAINNMALVSGSSNTSYFLNTRAVTGLRLSNLFLRSLPGFHLGGDNTSDGQTQPGFPNVTQNIIYENIGGNLGNGTSNSFINGVNFANFSMRNCVITGPIPMDINSAVINLPYNATNIPRIASINSCSFGNFGRGINCTNSILNLQVSDTSFTNVGFNAVRLAPDNIAEGVRFTNCSFIAHDPPTTGQIGALLQDGGTGGTGSNSRISFNNCQFLYWGKRAIELQDHTRNVHISNCQFEDNCAAPDNVPDEAVINIATGVDHITITGNQIYKKFTSGTYAHKPLYGINVLSTSPRIVITNNQIDDADILAAGLCVNNPNRGPAHLRKIHGNTRQVFEGQVVQVGPWIGLNLPAGTTGATVLPIANVSGIYQAVLQRRGKVVAITARANANITGPAGCITFNVTKNNAAFGQSCTTSTSPITYCFDEDIDGNDFLAGDRLGIWYTATSTYAPAGLDWSIFLSVYYD